MTEPVRIGVMGCADIARRRMLPAFAAATDVEIAAIASRDLAKAAPLAAEHGCRAVGGYDELLADASVMAVYLPLPPALHAGWIEAALLAGKHVLAEKPMTIDAASTTSLLALAASRGLVLMENLSFVHHSQHAAVRALLEDGTIGELRSLHAAFTVPLRSGDDIRYRSDLGGGALWDTGVYPVRVALDFLGTSLRVAGAVQWRRPEFPVDTGGAALLVDRGGVSAQLTFGLDHGYRSAYRLDGSKGSISVERAFTPPANYEPVVLVEDRSGTRVVRLRAEDQVANTVASFAAAVRSGARPNDDSRYQAELIDAIRSSFAPPAR